MLKIYQQPETDLEFQPASAVPDTAGSEHEDDSGPVLLNFESWRRKLHGSAQATAVRRARTLHENCICPQCQSPVIIPLELNNGWRDSAGDSIPGSASLVGFRCDHCEAEWPA